MPLKIINIILVIVCVLLSLLYTREYNKNIQNQQEAQHNLEILQKTNETLRKRSEYYQQAYEKLKEAMLEKERQHTKEMIESGRLLELIDEIQSDPNYKPLF